MSVRSQHCRLALRRREERKIREQVARELAEVEAAWKKRPPDRQPN
jgi:hypothetical protein